MRGEIVDHLEADEGLTVPVEGEARARRQRADRGGMTEPGTAHGAHRAGQRWQRTQSPAPTPAPNGSRNKR